MNRYIDWNCINGSENELIEGWEGLIVREIDWYI